MDWPALWQANQSEVPDPNLIYPGQVLQTTPAAVTGQFQGSQQPITQQQQPPQPADGTGTYGHPYFCGDGDGDGWDMPCSQLHQDQPQPVQQPAAVQQPQDPQPVTQQQQPVTQQQQPAASSGGGGGGGAAPGSFQACVIQRESGGNPSAVNSSSGAGGLYQFLPSTWASLGFSGLPQNASVATQNAAFAKAFAQSGTSPWAPSDGC